GGIPGNPPASPPDSARRRGSPGSGQPDGGALEWCSALRRIPPPTSLPCGPAPWPPPPRGRARRTLPPPAPGAAGGGRRRRGRRAHPPTVRPTRHKSGETRSRPKGGERRCLNGVDDAGSEDQGLGAGLAGHRDLPFPPNGAHEALELELQRLRFGCVQLRVLDDVLDPRRSQALPPTLETEEMPRALRQVERKISGRLEDPELPGALPRDAGGSDDRDGPVREFDAGVRDVDVRGQERRTRGPDVRDVLPHQLEDEIQVVDHEVEHHRHVRSAGREGREPVTLEEPGVLEIRHGGPHGPVEPLHVSHLELRPVLLRRGYQLLGTRDRIRERLFDEAGDAAGKRGEPDLGVRGRRHHHAHRVHLVEQGVETGVGHGPQLLGDVGQALGIPVVDAGELGALDVPEKAGVVVTEGAGADHADPHPRRGHTNTPRCEVSMNVRKVSTSGSAGSSARARAMPCVMLKSELKSSRYARLRASFTSAENPARCRPTELRPYSWSGFPTAFTYGGTS